MCYPLKFIPDNYYDDTELYVSDSDDDNNTHSQN